MNLTDLTQLAQTRRAVRHFRPDPIPEALLTQLLDTARWSPSGYNLQPTHFVTVTKPRLKPPLAKACLHQSQILEAPATVIFVGDRRVARNHLEKILHHDRLAGGINDEYEKRVRSFVSLAFDQNPMGLGWLWKSILPPVLQLFRPMPSIPAVHKAIGSLNRSCCLLCYLCWQQPQPAWPLVPWREWTLAAFVAY